METQMLQPIPYLSFDGKCAEALDFYADLFGGKVVSKMTYGEMAASEGMPSESSHLIVNGVLAFPGGAILYGGDAPAGRPFTPMAGLMLTLNFTNVEEAQRVFDGLSNGGEVSMPFEPSFWAEKFGMTTDKYGIHWAVNANLAI